MRRALRREVVGLLVLTCCLLAGCTSPAPSAPDSAAPTTTAAEAETTLAPEPPAPQVDASLEKALLTSADLAGLGLAEPTMRVSSRYPDGLERCDEIRSSSLLGPTSNESVGWTLSSPPTEVVHSVSRYAAGAAARGLSEMIEGVSWCAWREGHIGATHRQPMTLPALDQIDQRYAVCYVWVALTWCNIALRRGDVVSAVRLGWGAGSKMSLATVPALAQAAAKRMAALS